MARGQLEDNFVTAIEEPGTGLLFYELSHPWGHNTPTWPGNEDVKIERITYHAKFGVMTQKITMVMHSSTHMNAPIHLVQSTETVGDLAPDLFFGSGVVLGIPKGEWELIEPADLEAAGGDLKPGDIVLINTGWHHKYSDSQEYFGHAPGLSEDAANWLLDKGAKLVGVDTAAVDHPLATSLGPHRNGPQIKYLLPQYKEATEREAIEDFPDWNPAHKALLSAGVPTIENVGGDLDAVTGKRCTFHAMPWRWSEGDACVIRLVALMDPTGDYRLEAGN
jgi:kynurenine formamidase